MHGDELAGYILSLRLIDYILNDYSNIEADMTTSFMKIKKHNFIKGPYALAYTAGHDRGLGGVTHTNTCLLSFIEMICKKYKKYKKLQLIIPPWFCSDNEDKEISLLTSPQLKTKYNNIVKKYFSKKIVIFFLYP